jgi:hypothetical protein
MIQSKAARNLDAGPIDLAAGGKYGTILSQNRLPSHRLTKDAGRCGSLAWWAPLTQHIQPHTSTPCTTISFHHCSCQYHQCCSTGYLPMSVSLAASVALPLHRLPSNLPLTDASPAHRASLPFTSGPLPYTYNEAFIALWWHRTLAASHSGGICCLLVVLL